MTESQIDPHKVPVLAGVAQLIQRPPNVSDAVEPLELMAQVCEQAAADTGTTKVASLLSSLGLIAVVSGAWSYSDPGRLLARRFAADRATTMLSTVGGNTPQAMVNELAVRISSGELVSAVIVGAEAIWSRRRRRQAGLGPNRTKQTDHSPDEIFGTDVEMSTEFEASRGLTLPIHFYPLFESALAASSNLSATEYHRQTAEMWADFSAVAATNPNAWTRSLLTADEISTASPDNRMVAYPYTKAMCANIDVDQGAALILCSLAFAREHGVDGERLVFPLAGTDSADTTAVSNRPTLAGSPAIRGAADLLWDISDRQIDQVDQVDVYSCFPSAVRASAEAIGLQTQLRLTLTGGLTFAGGPFNNYVSHSISAMVQALRSSPSGLGLITANGGYLTKHSLGLYSTEAPPAGFAKARFTPDPSTQVSLDEAYSGPGRIEAFTVMHDRDGPTVALLAVRTPGRARTWGNSTDPAVMRRLMGSEPVGADVVLHSDGTVSL